MAIIVIHSLTKERISGTYTFEWSWHKINRLLNGELVIKSHLVNKDKAKMIIDREGLTVAYKTKKGEVYDTPGQDLKALFPMGLQAKSDIDAIEKVDRI